MVLQRKYVFAAIGAVVGVAAFFLILNKKESSNKEVKPKTPVKKIPEPKGLASLDVEARKKVEKFFDLAKKAGKPVMLVSARRSCEKQDALYAQGRTKPGKIITHAKCGQSDHNLGLAIDVAPLVNGKVNYNVPRSHWEELARIAKTVGLSWGGRWTNLNDLVHFSAGSR